GQKRLRGRAIHPADAEAVAYSGRLADRRVRAGRSGEGRRSGMRRRAREAVRAADGDRPRQGSAREGPAGRRIGRDTGRGAAAQAAPDDTETAAMPSPVAVSAPAPPPAAEPAPTAPAFLPSVALMAATELPPLGDAFAALLAAEQRDRPASEPPLWPGITPAA